jgi:hypothetical protein
MKINKIFLYFLSYKDKPKMNFNGNDESGDATFNNLTITEKGILPKDSFVDDNELVNKGYVDSNSGGNFDQSLNTSDDVEFKTVTAREPAVNQNNATLKNNILEFRGDPLNTSYGNVSYEDGSSYKVMKMEVNKGNFPAASQGRVVVDGSAYIFTANALSMQNRKIVSLLNPTNPQDAATKQYVDDNIGGGTQGPAGPQGEVGPAGPQGEVGPAGPQ